MEDGTNEKVNKDLVDNFNQALISRFSNPFFFSYFFSWIIFNWKFMAFMFFSNLSIEKKLESFGSYINFYGWILPLVGVFIYLIGFNYIDSFFLIIGKSGYKVKINAIYNRSSIKIESEVKLAQKKMDLIDQQISANRVTSLIDENVRLMDELKELESKLNDRDS